MVNSSIPVRKATEPMMERTPGTDPISSGEHRKLMPAYIFCRWCFGTHAVLSLDRTLSCLGTINIFSPFWYHNVQLYSISRKTSPALSKIAFGGTIEALFVVVGIRIRWPYLNSILISMRPYLCKLEYVLFKELHTPKAELCLLEQIS